MDKIIKELKNEIKDNNELVEMVCNQNMEHSKGIIDLKLKTLILNAKIEMLIEEMDKIKSKLNI